MGAYAYGSSCCPTTCGHGGGYNYVGMILVLFILLVIILRTWGWGV